MVQCSLADPWPWPLTPDPDLPWVKVVFPVVEVSQSFVTPQDCVFRYKALGKPSKPRPRNRRQLYSEPFGSGKIGTLFRVKVHRNLEQNFTWTINYHAMSDQNNKKEPSNHHKHSNYWLSIDSLFIMSTEFTDHQSIHCLLSDHYFTYIQWLSIDSMFIIWPLFYLYSVLSSITHHTYLGILYECIRLGLFSVFLKIFTN